jgi:hypothetical protein
MHDGKPHHVVEEQLGEPASYLTIRRGDRVYDLYGWAAGHVAELRIAATRDEFFDGLVVDFRGRSLFVDAPEVRSIHDGVVLLALTVGDLTRAASDPDAARCWPGGPRQVPPRRAAAAATAADASALSRMPASRWDGGQRRTYCPRSERHTDRWISRV